MLSPIAIRKAGFLNLPRKSFVASPLLAGVALSFALGLSGCAGRIAHPDTDTNHPHTPAQQEEPQGAASQNQNQQGSSDPRMSAAGLNARLDALEAKLAAMNDKLDATQHALDNFLTAHSPRMSGVNIPASEAAGTPVGATDENAPGFVQDAAVQLYRKANILFESERYADANLAYSNFLEKYPDHPLAGSAQFKIGEGYFRRKEYKQAVQEFQKVLTSYDRSPAISATLRDLSEAEDALDRPQEAARYRQQLTSLFPSSPAAQFPQTSVPLQQAISPQSDQPQTLAPANPDAAASGMSEDKAQPAPPQGQAKHDLDAPPPTAPLNGDKSGATNGT